MKSSKTKAARGRAKVGAIAISRNFQLVFLVAVAGSWLIGQVGFAVNLLLSDSYLTGTGWLMQGIQIAFPVLLLAIGYAFGNYVTPLQQSFDAALRALIGLGFFGFLSMLQNQIATAYAVSSASIPPAWLISVWTQITLMCATLVIYTAGQYWWSRRVRR
jgi:hypothetical protein